MSVWVTGDIHGNPERFSVDNFPEQKEMTKSDVVICLGDFGLVWNYEKEDKNEKYFLDWLEEKPFTTLFIDGNHENFDRLDSYPVEEWHGGKISFIRPSVIHLKRGEVFEIEGKKFFAFGSASSHDIQNGILDYEDEYWMQRAKELDRQGKYMYRIKGLSWWPQELPSKEEMQNGINNLEKHNWKVDYIISHSPPASIIALLGRGLYKQDVVTKYLEEIRSKLNFKKHLMGHMHEDIDIYDKDILLYEDIVRIL